MDIVDLTACSCSGYMWFHGLHVVAVAAYGRLRCRLLPWLYVVSCTACGCLFASGCRGCMWLLHVVAALVNPSECSDHKPYNTMLL